jgi:hypothetical protein
VVVVTVVGATVTIDCCEVGALVVVVVVGAPVAGAVVVVVT